MNEIKDLVGKTYKKTEEGTDTISKEETNAPQGGNVYGGEFCSPTEKQITTLGTGYVANFISSGGLGRSGATLTNKRVYFSGNAFTFNDKGSLVETKEQKIVNVRDVTGAGYKQYNPTHYIIKAAIAFVLGLAFDLTFLDSFGIGSGIGVLAGIGFGVMFHIYRKTLLSVEYAGGNISFDVRLFQPHEQDTFIRNIHLAKDKLYSRTAVEQGFTDSDSGDSEVDDDIPSL